MTDTYYIYYRGRITRTALTNEAVREYIETKLNDCGQKLSDFQVRKNGELLTLDGLRVWQVSVGGR